MATWRGHGGALTVLDTNTALGVRKTTIEESAALANKTNSKSLGHKQRQATVRDTAITVNLPWDSDQDPEALGLLPGAVCRLVANKGESTKTMTTQTFVIEKRSWELDQDEGLVELVLSGYSNEKMVHA